MKTAEIRSVVQQFIDWTKVKIQIHLSDKFVYFRDGEIWWASIGVNIGHEEQGKNKNFERPIVVLKKFNRYVLWAIPLTTKTKIDNPYYYQYRLYGKEYAAILPQLKLISSKRLLRRISMFPSDDYEKIKEQIKKLLQKNETHSQ